MAEFQDPHADVVLRCEGGTFRVHSYILKANSSVFLDMLETAQSGSEIPVEESSGTIINLLHVLYGKAAPSTATECQDLLEAADKYDVLHVENYIARNCRKLLEENSKLEAWQALCIAAQLDDQSPAKMALARLGNLARPGLWSVYEASQLGLRYYCGIMQAWDTCMETRVGYYNSSPDWKMVSAHFSLKD